MVSSPAIGAVDPQERILSIDILRAVALFGVLMVNLLTAFRVSMFSQFVQSGPSGSQRDRLLESFVAYALDMKAIALFSLLFGIGLAMQFDRLSSRGKPLYWLHRRLLVLLVFGLCHLILIWNGDILTEYALAGLLVLPLMRHDRETVAFYALVVMGFYVTMPILYGSIYWPSTLSFKQGVVAANQIYPHGNVLQILQHASQELKLIIPLHVSIVPRTIALMLIGAWVWKSGLLDDVRRQWQRWLVFGLLLTALGLCISVANKSDLISEYKQLGQMLSNLGQVVQSLGYAVLILIAAELSFLRRVLKLFAPMGKMAFTNYILQSLIFGWIFFGYGLGQFGRMSMSAAFLLGCVVYVSQGLGSILWLRHFRFGPLEWLWRSLTYGRRQPMLI